METLKKKFDLDENKFEQHKVHRCGFSDQINGKN
jgi:predicted nucleic-acid-binding Zn-ribbon protein